ncbi:hypothetical protein Pryu01_01214 [Paraliobacillus ryukyuensis]|uniref:Uncharacterized protein n=1 Tax=Paraliobacillus ryukyuensis TaxID=200904 RepID=A0A366DPV3_9BACI|nr:hypothetical protein [Paraliobacillus ryukyuensis]RBO92102.1 hypothetical protein DES48_11628 [Paraliobacillus ryukyuensis]
MNKEKLLSKFDLAVLLTLIIGISYVLTYLKYVGKFFIYDIPFYFIDVGAKEVSLTMLFLSPLFINLIIIVTSAFKYNFFTLFDLFSFNAFKQIKESENGIKNLKNKAISINEELNLYKQSLDKRDDNINIDSNLALTYSEKEEFLEKQNENSKLKEQLNESNTLLEEIEISIKKNKQLQLWYIIALCSFIIPILIFIYLSVISNNPKFYMSLFIFLFQLLTIQLSQKSIKKKKFLLLSLIIITCLTVIPICLGLINGYSNKDFYTFEKDENNYVVLTIYKDQFLYTEIDRNTNNINETFNLIDIKDVENFKLESLGRLQRE